MVTVLVTEIYMPKSRKQAEIDAAIYNTMRSRVAYFGNNFDEARVYAEHEYEHYRFGLNYTELQWGGNEMVTLRKDDDFVKIAIKES